jgi:hypothetical protein
LDESVNTICHTPTPKRELGKRIKVARTLIDTQCKAFSGESSKHCSKQVSVIMEHTTSPKDLGPSVIEQSQAYNDHEPDTAEAERRERGDLQPQLVPLELITRKSVKKGRTIARGGKSPQYAC